MRKISLFLIGSFVAVFAYAAMPQQNVTGLEWLQMSMGERMDSLLASMVVLDKSGVKLKRAPNDYYDAVRESLKAAPDLYSSDLTNILASIVYAKEPDTRPALEKLRSKVPR